MRFGAVDGQREADADVAAGPVDRGVDTDHAAPRIEQRAAAVAGVDGRIGLHHAFKMTVVLVLNIPAQSS